MATWISGRIGFARIAAPLAIAMLLAACSGTHAPARTAVAVQPDDTCAVCGMELSHSPGPRAQAWVAGRARPLMFDSTRDFFAYILQPENQASLQELFVQDAARIDWQQPGRDAASFIDARRAVYVAWQPLPGSMGPTLAPFANRAEAAAFVRKHGGAVLAFNQVTLPLIADLPGRCPAPEVAANGSTIPCRVTAAQSATGEPRGARGDAGIH
ncbi:MAG TPA: nitrous oxide reductase accessory protein NosL [Rhodanobacteraceae bacterium]|nr:nitrous oxide reductase accessory protein NosL [Rhodanobacteraceae bacterium]